MWLRYVYERTLLETEADSDSSSKQQIILALGCSIPRLCHLI